MRRPLQSRRPAHAEAAIEAVSTPILVRRAAHLVCYWKDRRLVFENFRARTRIAAAPITCQILDFFDDWRDPEEIVAHLREYSAPSVRRGIAALLGGSMLERRDRAPTAADRAFETWKSWNPAAGFFHFSSKDVVYERDPAASYRRLVRRAKRRPMPPPVKRYPGAPQIALPAPRTEGEFPRLLLARRTWRRFSREPLALSGLATLLGLTCAVQYWIELPGLGRVALKTSPSGGAVHPLETYVLARRVDGLDPGLYHYAADTHRLELLSKGATGRQILAYVPGQPWYRSAAALLFITAIFPRKQWRYEYPRAYRTVLTESGHLCQTFCLVATWLGLAPFCTLALADSRIERDLGLDGVSESVLYAAGLGAPPPNTSWAPAPDGTALVRHAGYLASVASSGGRAAAHAGRRQPRRPARRPTER